MLDDFEKVSISVSNDNLQAFMTLNDPYSITLSEIVREIQNAGISYGIKSSVIKDALERKLTFRKILIAEGRAPEHGIDGFVECLVDITPEPQRTIEDKSLNYFPVWITNVLENQKILKITPPTAGISGVSVTGRDLPAKSGKPPKAYRGLNTHISETNSNYLVASRSGNLVWKDGKAEINSEYRILGDVGLINGNIQFVGSLYISGSILSGITVKVDGNLEVGGSIEDSTIDVGGRVMVKGGFLGYGKGRIKAGGDVMIGHVINQSISTFENIHIQREAVNCELVCKSIFAKGAAIFGSTVIAQNLIEVHNLGRSLNSTTKVFAGNKRRITELIQSMDLEIREKEVRMVKLKEKIYGYITKKINSGSLSEEEEVDLNLMRREFESLPLRNKKLIEKRDKVIEDIKKKDQPKVVIFGSVFPNVLISICDAQIHVSNRETNLTFYEKFGSIVRLKNEI